MIIEKIREALQELGYNSNFRNFCIINKLYSVEYSNGSIIEMDQHLKIVAVYQA